MPATELDKWWGYLRFETILQHVDLPNLSILGGENLLTPFSSASEPSPDIRELIGRVDIVKILHWLRRKGVGKILELTVTDDESEPHYDEAIEAALKGFGIEILNWQKLDLCSDVLYNAVTDVRKLYLYSSGNSDVLKGWSSENGLERLPKVNHHQ